jgi:hypothetical protein
MKWRIPMKKQFAGIILMLFVGTFSWGQVTKEYFDAKKLRDEKEILSGILFTRLSYLSQKPGMSSKNYLPDISAFYLPGEGMVFVLSIRKSPIAFVSIFAGDDSSSAPFLSKKLMSLNSELAARTRELMRARGQLSGKTSPQDLQKSPALPAPPPPPDKITADRASKLEKMVEELKDEIKATSRQMENRNSLDLTKLLEELPPLIVETLANYGDSLTTVKPDEHINFVVGTESTLPGARFVISARKSWVADYKAGRLTLDEFKQKIIQYDD